ncbi:MAG: ABC transporter permease [Spirochaetaceae bacterium]|jgi:peptide/nickel transport system permease protein|nr:ABC transporter permease [Spirochaetaceae bacterium]
MLRYVLKRFLIFIPTLFAVVFIIYAVMEMTPGDPARAILGERAAEEQAALLREELGLDKPFFLRYLGYAYRLFLKGDPGVSYSRKTPVLDDILRKLPYTLTLALWPAFLSFFIGVSLGVFSACKPRSPADTVSSAIVLFFASIPGYVLGMLLMLVFSLGLHVLPAGGASSWRHFILPVAALTIPAVAGTVRLTRAMMIETLGRDYIRTAKAKGAGGGTVVLKHALKNALPPVIITSGMHFGYLLGGAVITETLFALPGLGSHVVDAVRMKDAPVVLASVVVLSAFFSAVLLILDLVCAFLDPRIRARYAGREDAPR